MRHLRGRVAVVTGAAAGVGAAMARTFCREGMRVVVADHDVAGAERVARELREMGGEAAGQRVDVGDVDSLAALANATAHAFGGVDLLAANVGVQRIGRFETLTHQDWQWLLNVNVLGTVETVRAFLPQLRASGDAHVLVTCSVSSLFAAPRLAAYTASKMAVLGFTETLRIELAEEGIPVTALIPAGMATTHLQSSMAARPSTLGAAPAPTLDDVNLLRDALAPTPDATISAEEAIRDLVHALREERAYLVTHAPNQANVEQRCAAILDAFAHARR
jgi:NAD(P)-dependent dehydrogenase (short-subunit alcohol dehydrogenase family)